MVDLIIKTRDLAIKLLLIAIFKLICFGVIDWILVQLCTVYKSHWGIRKPCHYHGSNICTYIVPNINTIKVSVKTGHHIEGGECVCHF